jgi:hypothetical protein
MTEEKARPDTDNEQELGKDSVPKMGEGETLPEGKEGEETTAPEIGKAEEQKLTPELEATMKRKGFKNVDELAKAYDASERAQTELEKDARLRSLTTAIPERPKAERTFTEVPELTEEPFNMSKEGLDAYLTKREKRAREELEAAYTDAEADKKWNRDYRETMAVVNKDPKRFAEIKPQLQELHAKYPDAPLSEIYPVADEMEKTQSSKKKDNFISEVFGPNTTQDDIAKLKTVMSKARPAVVSDAGGTGATGAGKKKAEDTIWDAIAGADVRRDS